MHSIPNLTYAEMSKSSSQLSLEDLLCSVEKDTLLRPIERRPRARRRSVGQEKKDLCLPVICVKGFSGLVSLEGLSALVRKAVFQSLTSLTLTALIAANLSVIGTVGYFAYMNWDKPKWDRRVVSAAAISIFTLWGGEGSVLYLSNLRSTRSHLFRSSNSYVAEQLREGKIHPPRK